MNKPKYHVASFSGGKDSTAMVLHMIERGDPLNEVMFCDTTMEFPAMIRHVEKVREVIEAAGIKFTELRAPHDFEVIQYIGIAADEDYRLERGQNQDPNHRHPLREWGWDENKALHYCYDRGYDWEGLYELKRNPKTKKARVSCWCCPLQSYEDMRILRKHYPDLWEKLLDLDSRQAKKFQHGYSVADFDLRFQLEDGLTAAGHSIKNRAFHTDMKRLLAGETTIDEILQGRANE